MIAIRYFNEHTVTTYTEEGAGRDFIRIKI
jgi:hypothetical protein